MATVTTNCGYVHVTLAYSKGKSKPFLVHRLVALTFIPNKEGKPQVNHLDGNKQNNSVSNLEWCTSSENSLHAYAIGLQEKVQGEEHAAAKLTNQEAKDIILLILSGNSNEEISTKYGLHSRYVSLIRHKQRWKHLWKTHFSNATAPKSKKLKGKFINIAEELVKESSTTETSNAIIAKRFGCDASLICHIRNRSKKCPSYLTLFINKYL